MRVQWDRKRRGRSRCTRTRFEVPNPLATIVHTTRPDGQGLAEGVVPNHESYLEAGSNGTQGHPGYLLVWMVYKIYRGCPRLRGRATVRGS